jgi:hypothetical protein
MRVLARTRAMLASTFLLCGLSGCRHQVPHYSDALMVYPEAKQVQWAKPEWRKSQVMDEVICQVDVDYPAESVISWISDQLKGRGWQARDEDYWNPGLPTSQVRDWTQSADATVQPQATVYQWNGQWDNGSGDITDYFLRYEYPPHGEYTLRVIAIFTPTSIAKQIPKTPQPQVRTETAAETEAAASFAGCYELRLGRWWPWGFGKENAYVTPPSRIQLITERGAQGFEQDGYLIRPMKSPMTGRGGPSYWQVKSDEKIDLIWTDGFTGVTLEMEKHGNELSGRAHPHFDAVPLIPRTAKVTAQRIACADK